MTMLIICWRLELRIGPWVNCRKFWISCPILSPDQKPFVYQSVMIGSTPVALSSVSYTHLTLPTICSV